MPNDRSALTPNQFPAGFYAPSANNQLNSYGQPNPQNAYPPSSSIYAAHPSGIAWQNQGTAGFTNPSNHYVYATHHNPQQYHESAQPPTFCQASYMNQTIAGITSSSLNYPYQQAYVAQVPPPPPSTGVKENRFKCQPCNLELDSSLALQTHQSTHIKCEKCAFTAAPKVVKGHYAAAHGQYSGSGFKSITIAVPGVRKVQRFSICVGNHPDDIKRWIAERRKRFPRQSQKNLVSSTESSTLCKETDRKSIDPKTDSGMLSTLLEGYGSSSSDEDEKDNALTEPGKSVSSAINSSDLSGATAATGDEKPLHQGNYRTRPCRYFMRNGKCRNGDHCNFSHDRSSCNPGHETYHETPSPKKAKVSQGVSASTNQPTSLLHKLLASDIQREATLTLKLLEYIVMSNFLQDSSSGITIFSDSAVQDNNRVN